MIFHVAAAALLFGGGSGIVRQLKKSVKAGGEAFKLTAEDALRRGAVMSGAAIFTLLTGLALIFNLGGFGVATPNYHAALGLMIVALAVHLALIRPSLKRVADQAQTGQVDEAVVSSSVKKVAAGQGVLHLLWLTMLVLMFVRF